MRRVALLFVACVACALPVAHADFGNYIEHEASGPTLSVRTDVGELRITAIDEAAFEVYYRETGVRQLPSFALADQIPAVSATLTDTGPRLEFSTGTLSAVIDKAPLAIRYTSKGQPLVAESDGYFHNATGRGFRFALDAGEKILGGGERVLGMDRRGHRLPLYNRAHYAYTSASEQMYYSLPAVMSSDKYMIVFDNSASGWLDVGATDKDVLAFEAVGGRTSYLVIAGDSYPALIKNYTDVTGRQPLPPRWAFGNFASRFGYHTEKETRDVVRRFHRQHIPLDAVVLDLYWYGPDIKGHVGNLDWDRDAFPHPRDMIDDFARQGVKTIPVTQPFVLSTSKHWQEAVDQGVLAKNADGEPYRFDFYFGNTGLIDIFDAHARQWFWQAYARLFDMGIAGTWGDLGEPEVHPDDIRHWLSDAGIEARGDEVHNAFGHTWARMVYENQRANYPDTRPLILMRSGFAGSQRYGLIPWTGDVSRSWGGLKPQVELGLQMSLFGLAYTHSDLGGFAEGEAFDKEMYIRWLQYGIFQPVYRPHAQEHIPSEPVFHDRETRNIVRDFIKLRYRLLPYNYTLAYENSTTGMPLMRPVFFEDEHDPDLIDEKDSYLWGDAFLVAPVTDPGLDAVDVDLPAGTWFDFWNGRRYEGGATVSIPVTLETIPVLVRAGSFIPMIGDIETTADYSSEELTLHYYADAAVRSATGKMYEDDGEDPRSLDEGRFELLKFRADQNGDSLAIKLRRDGGEYAGRPARRKLTFVIHNWTSPADTITFAGKSTRGKLQDRTLTVRVDWNHEPATLTVNEPPAGVKPVIYQVFMRLFGNKNTTNKPWGTIDENGVGKFADFSDEALQGIHELGVTHIWYTGVPHHALVTDYTDYGISDDDPDVVKGRAGSPYAIKDYYNVDPDLAVDPAHRLEEFEALIARTHFNGMKVIIDIVPNHVARRYESISKPAGVEDFGASDDTSVVWARNNDFYYIVGEDFRVPAGYLPLNGEAHPLADGRFAESPAKWTGNGSRVAQPGIDDWFETVKINFGVRPDGSHAFDSLPADARGWSNEQMATFWAAREVPQSWKKFRDIVHFWLDRGVDGFRYDIAQLVPVEFWSYLNSSIKLRKPDAFLMAEIYLPSLYRDFIQIGRMDYLYDKVGLYDAIRAVVQDDAPASSIATVQDDVLDIEQHLLHFLENHDEQRIASHGFAGDAREGKPGMVVAALLGSSPTMLYFGQELGVPGDGDAGFGKATRTTIFDYWGIPAQQRWMNGGKFDGAALSSDEKELRDFYARLLNLSASEPALQGDYAHLPVDHERVFAFTRWTEGQQLIVASNFDADENVEVELAVPTAVVSAWKLEDGRRALDDLLGGDAPNELLIDHGAGQVRIRLAPLQSVVYQVGAGLFKSLDAARFVDDPQGAGVQGTLIYWKDVESAFLAEPRHVVIWLPPAYEENPDQRYRVIYMSDGENLFDPRIASWGVDWGIDEAMMRGATNGDYEPAIVVGAFSSSQRGPEYSPWHGAPQYARFLIEELMPRVNAEFRTLQGPDNTFAMGSSMGGLLSYYLVKNHADIFGACGCVSSHFALSEKIVAGYFGTADDGADATPYIIRDIEAGATVPPGARFMFDYGTETLDSSYEKDHAPIREWLLGQGLVEGRDFEMLKYDGADHSERAWRARVHTQLEFLLGPADNKD